LPKYFGRDGRKEADESLRRRSGDRGSPRMLGAFNEKPNNQSIDLAA